MVGKLRECFARFRLPDLIVSDNGSQFISSIYNIFCDRNGIRIMYSPPYKPQCNGAAENAVKTFKGGLKKILEDPINRAVEIDTLVSRHLFYYRSSIHWSTGESPFKLLFGREMTQHTLIVSRQNYIQKLQVKVDEKFAKQKKNENSRNTRTEMM